MRMKSIKVTGVFCVIKYGVWVGNYETTEYAILRLKPRFWEWTMDVLPSREAKEIIDENNMVEVVKNKHGRVWELPDVSFKQKFRGKYKIIYD
jgi:hypothetical protein